MQLTTAIVLGCQRLGRHHSWLTLDCGAALEGSRPGQFAMLRGEWQRDPILPRAYSVVWVEAGQVGFLIRRVGRGSDRLARSKPGDQITVLGPLGRGFPPPAQGERELLVAGGCGVAPLYAVAIEAARKGKSGRLKLLLGARSDEELVLHDRLAAEGVDLRLVTEDGSAGETGLVTELLERELQLGAGERVLACGPEAMLRRVRELARQHARRCYLALEGPMACGIGVCLGCAVPARRVPFLQVCKDGPVFEAEEIWP